MRAAPARSGAWWSFIPGGICCARRRALELARDLHVGRAVLAAAGAVGGFINGVALHLASRQARRLFRPPNWRCASCIARICHNDLARSKLAAGTTAAPTSRTFKLAPASRPRPPFRIAAYEDLRHLLKHKRSYAPEALTPKERKISRAIAGRQHLASPQEGLRAITRGLFTLPTARRRPAGGQ